MRAIRFGARFHSVKAHAATHHDAPVLFSKINNAAVVTLNRPKALNALNLEMVRLMQAEVPGWDKDPSIRTVIFKGAGGKAFCAGGDIKTLYDKRYTEEARHKQYAFFSEEYKLDNALALSSQRKPHIAIWDGTVMGGGVGISINAKFRVATEKTLFAMPETGIGLFPDVGGSYFLPRLPRHLGVYLALTGQRLKGADLVHASIATHFIPSEQVANVESEISQISADHASTVSLVSRILDKYSAPLPAFSITANDLEHCIDPCFSAPTVEAIMDKLKDANSRGYAIAAQALAALHKMSPTSMKVTLEQMRRGARLSLEDCYKMELRLALRFMEGKDFFEGVRAVLVDKDNTPKWSPPELSAVTEKDVAAYFEHLSADKELQLPK